MPKPTPHQQDNQPGVRLIRKPQLLRKVQLSDVTIWRMEKTGNFPRRLQIGPNSVAWIEAEIDEWIADLAEAR